MIETRRFKLGAGLAGSAVFGFAALVYPAWRAERSVANRIESVRAQTEAISERAGELEGLRSRLESLQEFAAAHTKPTPAQSDVAGLIRGLSIHLDSLGIQTREIAVGAPARNGPITVMPMTVMMRCGFLDACAVIAHVESLPRLVRVRRFKIARERVNPGEEAGGSLLKAEILLEALASDEPTPPEIVATPATGGEP